jgi:hypothetical protein
MRLDIVFTTLALLQILLFVSVVGASAGKLSQRRRRSLVAEELDTQDIENINIKNSDKSRFRQSKIRFQNSGKSKSKSNGRNGKKRPAGGANRKNGLKQKKGSQNVAYEEDVEQLTVSDQEIDESVDISSRSSDNLAESSKKESKAITATASPVVYLATYPGACPGVTDRLPEKVPAALSYSPILSTQTCYKGSQGSLPGLQSYAVSSCKKMGAYITISGYGYPDTTCQGNAVPFVHSPSFFYGCNQASSSASNHTYYECFQ